MSNTTDDRLCLLGSSILVLGAYNGKLASLLDKLQARHNVQWEILSPTVAPSELERVAGARILLAVPEALAVVQQVGMRRLLRWRSLFLLVNKNDLLVASSALDLADGIIFLDGLEPRAESLELAMENVTVLPRYMNENFSLDQVRLAQLGGLKAIELSVLACLGEGLTNQLIGKRLGLGESQVKAAVRQLMVKLHFPNRTHAGVFAERIGGRLTSIVMSRNGQSGDRTPKPILSC